MFGQSRNLPAARAATARLVSMVPVDQKLDAGARAGLDAYVGELQDWLAGILHWHRSARRYRAEELHRPGDGLSTSVLSSGFGMSAARIGLRA
ncbi:hypothetical protein [Streptomyces sp. NBC_00091]|uniref:hypothetical protein n=1 Tax=Streptomyces sp. NBC_00091 TaxID=2975648 RepID=UPI00225B796E|nr:hypothetical protein [Streptomyces sp. NBC_00091]MCX5375130.1 hypothetical protein [Streptomyces sp. NBC_00091]